MIELKQRKDTYIVYNAHSVRCVKTAPILLFCSYGPGLLAELLMIIVLIFNFYTTFSIKSKASAATKQQ